MKKLMMKDEFINQLYDGMSIMVGGFMAVGTSEYLMDAIVESGVKNLTIICNDGGFPDRGVGKLIVNGQVSKLIASHIGLNPVAGDLMSKEEMEVELIPQGTLAERIRAGGAGLGGFLTPTGIGTLVENGKEIKVIDGIQYLLELPLKADLAILLGNEVDKKGNIVYSKTTRNFNPIMATAASKVIVAAKKIVEVGAISPDCIMTPHIFVDHIIEEAV